MFRKSGSVPEAEAFSPSAEQVAPALSQPIGRVESATGTIFGRRGCGSVARLGAGSLLYRGDTIETAANGAALLVFADGTSFRLSQGGRLVLDEFVCGENGGPDSAVFRLTWGAF